MVSRPRVASWNCKLFSNVVAIRAPVMPNGWPTAMAPPFTFKLAVTAKIGIGGDDLGRERLVDLHQVDVGDGHPGPPERLPGRFHRPEPMISGERAVTPEETIRASGVMPSSAALTSLIITSAAAPSLSGQQLPAVTVPFSQENGRQRRRPSRWRGTRAGAVVRGHRGTVGHRHRDDLTLPEAVGESLLGQVERILKWLNAPPSRHAREARLEIEIRVAHKRTRETSGPEKLQADLAEHGIRVGICRIRRIREKLGIRCKQIRKFKATTHSKHTLPVAENLVEQNFRVEAPNEVWVSDLTYVPTEEGGLYCAAHKDLFNGEIVGYALGSRIITDLVKESLSRAVGPRRPARGLIHHSDRGVSVLLPRIPEAARTVRHEGINEQKGQLLRRRPYRRAFGAP